MSMPAWSWLLPTTLISSRCRVLGQTACRSAALLIALGTGCDASEPRAENPPATPASESSSESTGDEPRRDPLRSPTEPIACEDVSEENTSGGPVRVHFARVSIGMSPELCGRVNGPNDALAFASYLQDRLTREPGCAECVINRVDLITLLDVDLVLEGRWRTDGAGERVFHTRMSSPFEVESSPDVQLEHAHFFFMRDAAAYEAYYEGLCPGSNPDPAGATPRAVSEECMRFTESAAPHASRPGL